MAASEPPEPPPRNPDRINASLHKLSESKNIKSLDSSIATINEKTINNNKPLKPILSLDHGSGSTSNNSTTAVTTTTVTAAQSALNVKSVTAANLTTANASVLSSTANLPTSIASIQTSPATALVYSKRNIAVSISAPTPATATATATAIATASAQEITPTGAADSIVSPLSSNGSSSNQALISPMTIDNQQHRLSFPNKNEAHAALMAQQQQQPNLNGTNATVALLNGGSSNAGSNALNANNTNANSAGASMVTVNHSNASTNA
ncbi:PREDICTED: uncharacterized protein LOC108357083, partial [Rhagoletis zephyria]|uniref:uncharacterized protein LOC108357083 n=1 Tax=Rhagoletis zephyria TaxID=28612 RepID=UPI00081143DC